MPPIPLAGPCAVSAPETIVVSLRWRLVAIICVIITIILCGQAIVGLSGEVSELDNRVNSQGSVVAQSVAAACEADSASHAPVCVDDVIARARRTVDLVEIAIVDRHRLIVAHSDPNRVGETYDAEPISAFGVRHPSRGLDALFGGALTYVASAPIVRGTRGLSGYVHLVYRSDVVTHRAVFIVLATAAWAIVWLVVGGISASIYVRHITAPLNALTEAAHALSEDRLDDVELAGASAGDEVGTLQHAFAHLVDALRTQRSENAKLLDELQLANTNLERRVDDVTADLRHAKDHLEAVISSLEEGVMSCTADGVITEVNAGVEFQLAGAYAPAPGGRVRELLPAGDEIEAAIRHVIDSGVCATVEAARPVPLEAREPGDPPERQLLFRICPLRGGPSGAVMTVLDVTEKRRLDAQLRRHDRLISLGTIAAGLAHELGNRMHIIQGFSALLQTRTPEDHPNRPDVDAIHGENERAVTLLGRFLQFARAGEGSFHTVCVDEVVRESLEICAPKLRERRVTVETALETGDLAIRCDSRLLDQAFVNLIFNAADAMADRPERRLTISSRHAGADAAKITFRDTGPGIPPAIRDRIFDPFFTTKSAEGTGLGLSIAHQVIDGHGGAMTVASEEGRGTTFTVRLPVDGPRGTPV